MKILKSFFLVILMLVLFAVPVFGHSGGTDSNGGHWDHQNGGYHYHHGNPPHLHENGICPYEMTGNESAENPINNNSSEHKGLLYTIVQWSITLVLLGALGFSIIYCGYCMIKVTRKK